MKLLLLLPLLLQPQVAANGPLEFEPYEPIVLSSDYEVKEGWQVQVDWTIESPAQLREIENGTKAHVWARPGKYQATVVIFAVNFEEKKFEKEKKWFTILVKGKEPDPDPDPPGPKPPRPTNDLQKDIRELTKDNPNRARFADIAKEAAKKLENPMGNLLTVVEVNQWVKERVEVLETDFSQVLKRINQELINVDDRFDMVKIWKDVAAGAGG